MTDTPDAAPETPERKRRFRFGYLGICACVFFLFILTWVGVKLWWVHALNSEVAALRAAGEPITWAEVIDSIEPIPDEENAALVLQPLLSTWSAWEETPSFMLVICRRSHEFGSRRSDEMLGVMRAFVGESGAVLDVLHEAAACPRGRWPVDRDPSGYEHDDNYNGFLRRGVRLLNAESELRLAEGDGHGAAVAIRAVRRMGASLDASPYSNDMFVRIRCGGTVCDVTERALAQSQLPAPDLAMLRGEFAAEAQQLSLHVLARAARAAYYRHVTVGREAAKAVCAATSGVNYSRMTKLLVPGIVERDAFYALKDSTVWIKLLDRTLLELNPREFLAELKTVCVVKNPEVEDRRRTLYDDGGMADFSAFYQVSRSVVVGKQRMHVARAALAVEQFRMERGRWPEKLADLVPDYLDAVPQDWFAPKGVTISYGPTATGVRIWSCAEGNAAGLTARESGELESLADTIATAKHAGDSFCIPKSLDELVPEYVKSIPVDPRTGKPYTYVTNPANPDLFIIGGYTAGKTEDAFWKQTISTRECAWRYPSARTPIVFRLLNAELRSATQSRFGDDVDVYNSAYELQDLGYTPERLTELGFSDEQMRIYKTQLKEREEYEREEAAEKAREQASPPDVPPDTPEEPAP